MDVSRPDGCHEPPHELQPLRPRRSLRRNQIGQALGGLLIWLFVAASVPTTLAGWVHLIADVLGPWSDEVLRLEDRIANAVPLGYLGPGVVGPLLAVLAFIWIPPAFRESRKVRRIVQLAAILAWAFPVYAFFQAFVQVWT